MSINPLCPRIPRHAIGRTRRDSYFDPPWRFQLAETEELLSMSSHAVLSPEMLGRLISRRLDDRAAQMAHLHGQDRLSPLPGGSPVAPSRIGQAQTTLLPLLAGAVVTDWPRSSHLRAGLRDRSRPECAVAGSSQRFPGGLHPFREVGEVRASGARGISGQTRLDRVASRAGTVRGTYEILVRNL